MRPPMTDDELMHFGIKGMKWGVRRFQNPDGTRTPAGLKRYGKAPRFITKLRDKRASKRIASQQKSDRARVGEMSDEEIDKRINRLRKEKELLNLMEDTKVQEAGKKRIKLGLAETGSKLIKDAAYKMGMDYVGEFMKSRSKTEQLKRAADKLKYNQDKFNYEKAKHDFERTKEREDFTKAKEDLKYRQDRLKYQQDKFKYYKDVDAWANSGSGGKKKKKKK